MLDNKYDPVTERIWSYYIKFADAMGFIYNDKVKDMLSSAVETAKEFNTSDEWDYNNLTAEQVFLVMELIRMAEHGFYMLKCQRCGKPFMTNRRSHFCRRVNEDGTHCYEGASKEKFQEKLQTDEPLKIYTRKYKAMFARYRSGKMSKEAFNMWHVQAKDKLEQTRNGEMNLIDYEKWLKST